VLVLTFGLVGPFVYLMSLMSTIGAAIRKDEPAEGAGWLFFHPTKLGPILGASWLFAPFFAIIASTCFVSVDRHLRIECAVGLAVVAVCSIVKAMGLRESFLRKEFESKRK